MIEWTDTLKTGHEEVDADHCGLVSLINDLESDLRSRVAVDTIRDSIYHLRDYAERHFAREEARMLEVSCPAYGRNKAEHARFVQRLAGWVKRLETEGPSRLLAFEVYHDSSNWFVAHLAGTDCELRGCKRSHPRPAESACR